MAISQCISLSDENRLDGFFRIDETGTHGTKEFPVALYNDDVTAKYVNWHWHEEFEAGFVTEGCVTVACGSRKYELEKGDVFFVNSDVLHAMRNGRAAAPSVFRSVAFGGSVIGGEPGSLFSKKYLLPVLNSPAFRDLVIRKGDAFHAESLSILESIWDEVSEEAPDYEVKVRNLLTMLFSLLLKIHPSEPATGECYTQENRVRTLLDYIRANYQKNLTLEGLAKATSVSKTEVLRCFKQIIGKSPIQYIKNYRLQRAACLLSNTDEPIGQIALECGFEDSSYFTRSFKAAFGCTPQEYRRKTPHSAMV